MRLPFAPRLPRRFSADLVIALVLTLALGALWTVSLRMAAQVERDGTASAFAETRSLARLLTLHWSELVQRVDSLQRLARLVTRAHLAGSAEEPALLAELRASVELAGSRVLQVSATDPAGTVIWSTLPMPPERVNLAQREHYQAIVRDHRDHFIGRPVLGAVSGRWSIQFTEAARDPDGTLRGITMVSVDAELVEELARELNMADRGIIAILRGDGVVLARSPNRNLGSIIPPGTSLWPLAWRTGAADGLAPGPLDRVLRFYAVRRVAGSEVIVVIGLDADAQLAPVHAVTDHIRRLTAELGLALAGIAFAVSLGIRRQRILKRERQHSRDLAQREALLRQLAERASDIISLLDAQWRNIFVSPAIRTVLGLDPQQMIGQRFAAHILPEDAPVLDAALAVLARDGGAQRIVFRAQHADGSPRWLETDMVAVGCRDAAAGTGCRYVSITRDITSRKQDEEVLRQTQQQLETLYRLGPGALYEVAISPDGHRRVTIPFPGPLLGMGSGAEDLNASFFRRRVHPLDLPGALEAKRRCMDTGQAVAEYRLRSATGEVRWVRDQMRVAVREADCTIVVGYLTDITAEHEARIRLQQAERLATLGEVATGIAHEMNQPLAAIAMAAENGARALARDPLARRTTGMQTAAAKFVRIREQAERLSAVIDHIRSFGRQETEHAVAFTVEEVVERTLLLVAARLESARARVAVDLPPGLGQLHGAPILLEQVLMNLIVNACDAWEDAAEADGVAAADGKAAGRCIRLTARRDGDAVRLSVADRAGGIPGDVIERVFDPFFTTKPPGKGTGLGLSISFATISEMGGQLSVRNEDGGAVFDILLPAADGAALPRPPAGALPVAL